MAAGKFIITDRAWSETRRLAKKEGRPPKLRVGLRAGGCNGFSYIIDWLEEVLHEDFIFEKSGVEVFIDPKSMELLDGSTLDYETSIMGRGFVVNSPKSTGSCGCGASVQF